MAKIFVGVKFALFFRVQIHILNIWLRIIVYFLLLHVLRKVFKWVFAFRDMLFYLFIILFYIFNYLEDEISVVGWLVEKSLGNFWERFEWDWPFLGLGIRRRLFYYLNVSFSEIRVNSICVNLLAYSNCDKYIILGPNILKISFWKSLKVNSLLFDIFLSFLI